MARAAAGNELRSPFTNSFVPGWAAERDNTVLLRILRETPMPGPIRITLEREPDFFAAANLGWGRLATAVAREPETAEPFAMCSRSVRRHFINGHPVPVGYLSQLRVLAGHRAHKLRLLRLGFEWMAGTHQPAEAAFDFTTLVEGNSSAARLLTAGLAGLPKYTELERISTFLMPIHRVRPRKSTIEIRRLGLGESAVIDCWRRFGERHQFAPDWAPEDFGGSSAEPGRTGHALPIEEAFAAVRGGRVVGCVGVWDQRPHKQAVVRGYSRVLAWSRPLLNLLGAGLPPCGGVLPLAWLAPFGIDEDSSATFEALVAAVSAALRGSSDVRWLALMLADRHPLAPAARRLAARHYVSRLFVVHSPETRVDLDGRVPYLEGALL